MDRCCITCKYYHGGECKCKEFRNSFKTTVEVGYDYTEQGYLFDNLQESNIINQIVGVIYTDLAEKDILKRNRAFKNYDYENIGLKILLEIDEAISPGINHFFTGEAKNSIINNPSEFYCCYWE